MPQEVLEPPGIHALGRQRVARRMSDHMHMHGERQLGSLQTEVPPTAVLLRREPEDYYDEGEVVIDPYLLGKVKLIETL